MNGNLPIYRRDTTAGAGDFNIQIPFSFREMPYTVCGPAMLNRGGRYEKIVNQATENSEKCDFCYRYSGWYFTMEIST